MIHKKCKTCPPGTPPKSLIEFYRKDCNLDGYESVCIRCIANRRKKSVHYGPVSGAMCGASDAPTTKDKSRVTCGRCKRSRAFRGVKDT